LKAASFLCVGHRWVGITLAAVSGAAGVGRPRSSLRFDVVRHASNLQRQGDSGTRVGKTQDRMASTAIAEITPMQVDLYETALTQATTPWRSCPLTTMSGDGTDNFPPAIWSIALRAAWQAEMSDGFRSFVEGQATGVPSYQRAQLRDLLPNRRARGMVPSLWPRRGGGGSARHHRHESRRRKR